MNRTTFWTTVIGAGAAAALAYQVVHRSRVACAAARRDDDRVNQAIDDSFPASDPPSYTPTSGTTVGSHDSV